METKILSICLLFLILVIGVESGDLEKTYVSTRLPDLTKAELSAEDDVEGAPPDHVVPHSDHEDPEEPSTRSKYTDPSGRPTAPSKVELDFVPTKLYAQVRKTHTVKRLPREEALKTASNEEEVLAAPRLREVVSKSKKNTVYTEEGYEDAAYDHAGHIRDADFHEGFARKLEDERTDKRNVEDGKNLEVDQEEETNSDEAEESEDFNDDYRDHDSTIRESKIENIQDDEGVPEYQKIKNLWGDSSLNAKQVAENEIEKLEEDLEKEYEESERHTETQVPENLKNPRGDDEAEGNSSGESTSEEEIDESMESLKDSSSTGYGKKEDFPISSPRSTQDISTSVSPSTDYGKIFWEYFKSIGDNHKPPETSERSVAEESASIPTLESIRTTLADFDRKFDPPTTEFSNTSDNSKSDDDEFSAGSLYESWKRRDRYENSEESPERDFESSDSYVTKYEDLRDPEGQEEGQSLKLQNGEASTTLIGPKKLSYTVIIRPSEGSLTKSPPCDREDHTASEDGIPIFKSTPTKFSDDFKDQTIPEINDPAPENDFTVVQAPLSIPLRQVTYADFLPDSYATPIRPSVTREIGTTGEKILNNGGRDHYDSMKAFYPKRGKNPHPRYNRYRNHKKNLHHFYPTTKLVPPLPINRSEYSNYLGIKRVGEPIKRFDKNLSYRPWPDIVRFYRSLNRNVLGRRRRSLASIHSEKSSKDSVILTGERKLRRKRNSFREPNRLVGSDNFGLEKSIGSGTRKRRNDEKLLQEAPRIVDKIINDEIESRFKDEDDEATKEEDERGKIEIEVPRFNFSEVTENREKENVTKDPAIAKPFLDKRKYPFYENAKVPRSSALRYVTDPRKVPRKTLGGTEFYDSRDRYRKCDEVDPDLESVLPEEEEPSKDKEPRGEEPRLRGLGDSLDCFRAKYFDDDPLDNPLFLEEQVGPPRMPEELDPRKFGSRIFTELANASEEEPPVVRRISRKPEVLERRSGSRKSRIAKNHSRRRKNEQPTTIAPGIQVTPYQRQVYEDVMGTIKNLVGLRESFGEPIASSTLQSSFNHTTVNPEEENANLETIYITEKPRDFEIRGLVPPQRKNPGKPRRYRIYPYRTNKVSYRTRARTLTPPNEDEAKVGYFRTVTVHKRSISDEAMSLDLEPHETRNLGASLPEKPAASERIVYTIRDRIRYSKPRGVSGKYGKFTNLETSGSDDARRREPRYNAINNKKEPANDPEESASSVKNSTAANVTSGRLDFHDEPNELYKIQYSTVHGSQIEPSKLEDRNVEEQKKNQRRNYDVREDLNEDVTTTVANEDEPTKSTEFVELRKYLESDPPGYSEAFDGRSKESSSKYSEDEDPGKYSKMTEARQESKEDVEDEDDDDDDEEQVEKPSDAYHDEESSSKSSEDEEDSLGESESYKNTEAHEEDEEEDAEEEDESHSPQIEDETSSHVEDGEKEFERFASRPFSPFESYDDPKYKDLGPRLSKPFFHHPSFSSVRNEGNKYSKASDSDEDSKSEEEKPSRYVFPWEADNIEDEESAEGSNDDVRKIERYEYPWERRERLARERRRRAKEREKYEKLYNFSDDVESEADDEEEDGSHTQLRERHVYPWENYGSPSKNSRRKKTIRRFDDNEGTSTNHRPKFSSRYKTENVFLRKEEDPIVTSAADPPEIKVSIAHSFDKEPRNTPNKRLQIRKNILQQNVTTPEAIVTSTSGTPVFTVPSRNSKTRRNRTNLGSTIPPANSWTVRNRKLRIWHGNPSTTGKPLVASSRPVGKVRRRGQKIGWLTTPATTTTGRPARRRIQKTTLIPEEAKTIGQDSTLKNSIENTTNPKVKTVEHRSRISKEEIITKTSYPELSNDSYDKGEGIVDGEKNSKSSEPREDFTNESVKKISITTKETPDRIYRTEEIDKNGIKGMFVSITPNDRSNSSMDSMEDFEDRLIDPEEKKEMLRGFQDSQENEDEDPEVSFTRDSHLLANLMRQVPPYMDNSTLDDKDEELPVPEGSGFLEDDEDEEDDSKMEIRTNYVKDPNQRMYYYVEDL